MKGRWVSVVTSPDGISATEISRVAKLPSRVKITVDGRAKTVELWLYLKERYREKVIKPKSDRKNHDGSQHGLEPPKPSNIL